MAAVESREEKSFQQKCKKSDVNQSFSCASCIEYQYKLNELELELKSVNKIIQLLRNERVATQDGISVKRNTSSVNNYLNNPWVIVAGKCKTSKTSTNVSDLSPELFPIPTILTTNRYQILHNLQDDIESYSIVSNHHINNQPNRRAAKEKETKILQKHVKCNKKIVMIG